MEDNKENDYNALTEAQVQMCRSFTATIGQNSHHPCLFTRRFNKKKKKYTYYLYSADEQFVFAGATTLGEEHVFTISLNTNDFANKKWCLGTLQNTLNNLFTGIFISHETQDCSYHNSIQIALNPNQKTIQVKIAPPGQTKFIFVDGNSAELKPWILTQSKDPNVISNDLNFVLNYNGILSFNFIQVHNDEFQVQCGYPLSLFQSFCICVAVVSSMT